MLALPPQPAAVIRTIEQNAGAIHPHVQFVKRYPTVLGAMKAAEALTEGHTVKWPMLPNVTAYLVKVKGLFPHLLYPHPAVKVTPPKGMMFIVGADGTLFGEVGLPKV